MANRFLQNPNPKAILQYNWHKRQNARGRPVTNLFKSTNISIFIMIKHMVGKKQILLKIEFAKQNVEGKGMTFNGLF